MKTKTIFTWAIAFLLVFVLATGCSNMDNARIDLSENPQQKKEAFDQILNNEELLNEFMNEVMDHSASMNWMMDNQNFMDNMFSEENFDYMRRQNPNINNRMMDGMMNNMERDTTFAREFNRRIKERGLIHENMMK